MTYDSRIYWWIATFPFPTKCPDNSYSHRGGCWSRGMFYPSYIGIISLMGMPSLSQFCHQRITHLYPEISFLCWSDHLPKQWSCICHYLHQNSSSSDTANYYYLFILAARCHRLIECCQEFDQTSSLLLFRVSLAHPRYGRSWTTIGVGALKFSVTPEFSLNNYWCILWRAFELSHGNAC